MERKICIIQFVDLIKMSLGGQVVGFRKFMSRRSRREEQLLKEQATVGQLRAERKELEELAGRKKMEAARSKGLRMGEDDEIKVSIRPLRVPRAGKPLKRP